MPPKIPKVDWLEALRAQAENLEWLEPEAREELTEQLHEDYRGKGPVFVPLGEHARQLARVMLDRLTPIARAPLGPARPSVVERSALLFIEPNEPQHLVAAVHEAIPPFLWFPAGQTLAQLDEALAPYRHPANPSALEAPGRARAFVGTPGILDMDRKGMLDHFSMTPLAESLFWGSAHPQDPWPEDIATEDLPEFVEGAGEYMAQREGATWSMSFRSIASRAVITLEDHDGLFAAQVRYWPGGHEPLIGALREQFQMSWPQDLPVDVAALFVGLHFEDRARLTELVAARQPAEGLDRLIFDLYALSVIGHGDLSVVEVLRPFAEHDALQVRTAIADIAIRRGYDFLLARMAAREPDDGLRAQLLERL